MLVGRQGIPGDLYEAAAIDGAPTLAMAGLRQQTMGAIDYGSLEAGVVVMATPCIFLFLLLQGQYVRGFMSGAIKG